MRILIAGGSGLLGQALVRRLLERNHQVVVLGRGRDGATGPDVRRVVWTPDGTVGDWAREIEDADVIVNLAGAGIADRRWTPARKALLRSSRIDSTHSLVSAVSAAAERPRVFIQGSAVGYYGSTSTDVLADETSPPGSDFLSALASEWEAAAAPVTGSGARLVVIRTGVVLTGEGGALPQMARPFRFFVGGPIGTGRQYLSWITIDDWVSLVEWSIGTAEVHGAINATAPAPVTNAVFSSALAGVLRRPNLVPAPAFALRALFGEMAEALLLGGQRVVPAKALAFGFRFHDADIDAALARLL